MVITAAICRSVRPDTNIPKSFMGKESPHTRQMKKDSRMEKVKPWDPLEQPKLNLGQGNAPGKPPKRQAAFLSFRSFCRDPYTCKHFPCAGVWVTQLLRQPSGTAMESRGSWRTLALQLNHGPFRHLSAWDHASAQPQDLHRKMLHAESSFLQYGYSYDYCSILCVLHFT